MSKRNMDRHDLAHMMHFLAVFELKPLFRAIMAEFRPQMGSQGA